MLTLAALILSTSTYATPSLTLDPFKPSFKQQVDLGTKAAADIRKKEKVLPDNDKYVVMLRRLAAKVVAQIPEAEKKKKPYAFSFDVIQSKDVNAFALPGGPVFFFTGLLEKMSSEDEVAAVLGHELTHVREEHWANAYADQQKRGLGLTALLIILRANSTVVNMASIANEVAWSLPFSRKMESKADEVGFQVMTGAGYNPTGMVNVFETLAKLSKDGAPEFLKTHPDDKNRVKKIKEYIAKAEKGGKKWPAMTSLPK